MSFIQAVLLGLLQGATEFLPVSSSGHLVIVPHLLGWSEAPLVFDTTVHLGTLVAVLVYFWRDVLMLARAGWSSLRERAINTPEARLAWAVVIGTVPAVLIGLALEDFFEQLFGMPRAVAVFLLGTAALLLVSEYIRQRRALLEPARALEEGMTWRDAVLIGLGQSMAIAPGLSRSGSTMSVALLSGYQREAAARFSFLLSIPIILGSGAYQLLKVMRGGWLPVSPRILVGGFLAAALTGYVAIVGLMAWVRRSSLWPFAAYCGLLSVLVLTGVLG